MFNMNFYDFFILLSVVFGLAYYFVRQRYSYWERLNVPYIVPEFPFGNLKPLWGPQHISAVFQKYYHELKSQTAFPFGGIYMFINPSVMAIDLDFVKSVLIKDFNNFVSRGTYYNEKDDPLSANLFLMDGGEKWKGLRSKMTPTFTSGKMKFMFRTVTYVADEFQRAINLLIDSKNGDLEMREIISRFTTDVIGTCAFGIECNSLKNPNSDFRKYGRVIFEKPRHSFLKLMLLSSFRETARKLRIKLTGADLREFFMSSLKETIRYREANNVQRNDFLNLMMQLQKHGKLDDDENEDDSENKKLSYEEICAQSFVFFLAGFETSSLTMTFCLFELSVNLDIQNKARQEVIDVLDKHNGEFTYEALMEMRYVDFCIQETLRKYPPVTSIIRNCENDYPVPNTKVTIAKGTRITIPVYAIHHDPQIYSNPDLFDPDRFLPEEVQKRNPLSFIAFGEGPRNCIGLRFGLMQVKVGIVMLLKNFEFLPCSKSTNPMIFSPKSLPLSPKDGLWLNVKNIKVSN